MKIDQLRAELDALRQRYAADPRNYRLGELVGRAEQQWRHHATSEQREREIADAAAAHIARVNAARGEQPLTPPQWSDSLPETCPGCGEKVSVGYVRRLGERGWLCAKSASCSYEGRV